MTETGDRGAGPMSDGVPPVGGTSPGDVPWDGGPSPGDVPWDGGPSSDDAPLADLTVGGPVPLEDLGAPGGGLVPDRRERLPDLTEAPRAPQDTPGAPREDGEVDDDWAPAPPAVGGAADTASSAGAGGDDWVALGDVTTRAGRRDGRGRGRRRARSAGRRAARQDGGPAAEPLDAGPSGLDPHDAGRPGLEPHDPQAPQPTRPGRARSRAGRSADEPSGTGRSVPDPSGPPSVEPDASGTTQSADGLPPGALGAGAAGPAALWSTPDAAGGVPEGASTGRRAGSRRRSRRGTRGGATADADAAPAAAAESARPLTAEERLQHALGLAYRHLSKRDRTVSEVRAHLEKREVDEASVAGAMQELVAFGYVDDERYAARFVEDKRRLEGWGQLRIEQGLRRTGIPREIADRALADDPLRSDEREIAVEALERRLNGRALDDDRARQKALRFLATKGYPLETAYAAVRTYERRLAERDDA